MKKTVLFLAGFLMILAACNKNNLPVGSDSDIVQHILQKNLSAADLNAADLSSLQTSILHSGHHIYRLQMGKENIVLETHGTNQFEKGAIYNITGSVSQLNGHASFSGSFSRSDLSRKSAVNWAIEKGMVKELHHYNGVVANGSVQQHVNYECADCTLPEVIVSSSYSSGGGIDWFTWMSLLSMFDMGSYNDYLAAYIPSGGGGGGAAPSAPVVTIDRETSENKTPIDIKKYLNCFGTIPDAGANCVITISTDIPMDGHPEQIFDWSQGNPGHVFIELYKLGNSGLVSQNFGLYPSVGFLALTGLDIPSKVVDNAGHEYNARYSISVTPSQFQAAINTASNLGTQGYNIATFNCTDFALAVFNAAGGNLSIPQRQIPGFPNGTTGSNTPQGLYQQLDNMKAAGTSGIDVIGSKAYGGLSHGPCN